MRRARKKISCICGARFKVNPIAIRDSLSVNCPACGQKITAANNMDFKNVIDNINVIKSSLADYGTPYHTIAHYMYNKQFNKRENPLQEYNILME